MMQRESIIVWVFVLLQATSAWSAERPAEWHQVDWQRACRETHEAEELIFSIGDGPRSAMRDAFYHSSELREIFKFPRDYTCLFPFPAIHTIVYHANSQDPLFKPVIKALMLIGFDINALNYRKETALHFAVTDGNLGAVRVLLDLGAHMDVADGSSRTLLEIIEQQEQQYARLHKLLSKPGPRSVAYHEGCRILDRYAAVRCFLREKAGINEVPAKRQYCCMRWFFRKKV